jgi:hypothetical protein
VTKTYILDIAVGNRVAVRQNYQSWRGSIVAVDRSKISVLMSDGTLRKFAPGSKLEIGAMGHKWMRPYLCTVAEADERDRAHQAATARVAERLRTGTSPDWSVVKGMSF